MRPCIALCVGQLANYHMGNMEEQGDTARRQKMVAIVSEMIHTVSLVHDDILDHAETRRGKECEREVGHQEVQHWWGLHPGCWVQTAVPGWGQGGRGHP